MTPRKTIDKRAEALASLHALRLLVKEVGGNYLARLQADVSHVEQAICDLPSEKKAARKQEAQFVLLCKRVNALELKPDKGRRRDLKALDELIKKLTDMTDEW